MPAGSELQGRAQKVVVAAAIPQALLGEISPQAQVREHVVGGTVRLARICPVQVLLQFEHSKGAGASVEVPHQDDRVALFRVLADQPEQIEGRGIATAEATRIGGIRSPVVHEEHGGLLLHVLQPHPIGGAHRKIHLSRIFCHGLGTHVHQHPCRLLVAHAEAVPSFEDVVVIQKPGITEHALGILALLNPMKSNGTPLLACQPMSFPALPLLPPCMPNKSHQFRLYVKTRTFSRGTSSR
mmetsp:Transcript_71652/g.232985  ORF Transcript_71652/g.232985 Transcript_71652/m.232985 type:complete len:240 (+) Transcript_71652:784-1503(+)